MKKLLLGLIVISLIFSGCVDNNTPVGELKEVGFEELNSESIIAPIYDETNYEIEDNFNPTVPEVEISPFEQAYPDQDLTCTASGSADEDGTEIEYIYYWEKNETEQEQFDNQRTIPASATSEGDVWACYAIAFSNGKYSELAGGDAVLIKEKEGNISLEVELIPSPTAGTTDNLKCSATGPAGSYVYIWEKNEVEQEDYKNQKTIPPSVTSLDEMWTCKVRVQSSLTGEYSEWVSASTNIVIQEDSLIPPSVTFKPVRYVNGERVSYDSEDLVCEFAKDYDTQGGDFDYEVVTYRNNSKFSEQMFDEPGSITISHTDTFVGDIWECNARARLERYPSEWTEVSNSIIADPEDEYQEYADGTCSNNEYSTVVGSGGMSLSNAVRNIYYAFIRLDWDDARTLGEKLETEGDSALEGISNLVCIENIKIPFFFSQYTPQDITPLGNLSNLKYIDLDCGGKEVNISPFKNLSKMEMLQLRSCKTIDLSNFQNMNNLELLILEANDSVLNQSSIDSLPNLEIVKLSNNGLTNISLVKNLPKLKSLILSRENISNLNSLSELNQLESLEIFNSSNIADISVLSNLTNLKFLAITGAKISDISVISQMSTLENLNLKWNQITDVTPLHNLNNLKYLNVTGNNIPQSDCDALEAALPNTEVHCLVP